MSRQDDDDTRQRVMNMQVLADYQGDISCSLMDLVSKMDEHQGTTTPQQQQRDKLVYYTVRFLELQARAGASNEAMRGEIAKINRLFDEYTGQRADEKGSPYAKLISIYWQSMRKAERRESSRSDT
ncbi:hypothetical protein CDD81_4244 [Ophiocordyceps australis]|uniref:Uncharacterized protein n=1 Tax=Ophiocordyceps australis TaxID=1399860 RepID=A0A2C5YAI1_9HYPO|nr:hypothetical protein CDD81_4244 [Ophiocordyceps australis]